MHELNQIYKNRIKDSVSLLPWSGVGLCFIFATWATSFEKEGQCEYLFGTHCPFPSLSISPKVEFSSQSTKQAEGATSFFLS